MKFRKDCEYTLITSLMILIACLGFTFRDNRKKIFYIPLGMTGIYLVVEREYNRKANRRDLLNKIKIFSRK